MTVLQTGMAMNHSAEGVGPTKDKLIGAQRRGIGKDRGGIQCAVIYPSKIVEQSQCCCRVIESKGQGSIPSWLTFWELLAYESWGVTSDA